LGNNADKQGLAHTQKQPLGTKRDKGRYLEKVYKRRDNAIGESILSQLIIKNGAACFMKQPPTGLRPVGENFICSCISEALHFFWHTQLLLGAILKKK